jgi:hypothetical protein
MGGIVPSGRRVLALLGLSMGLLGIVSSVAAAQYPMIGLGGIPGCTHDEGNPDQYMAGARVTDDSSLRAGWLRVIVNPTVGPINMGDDWSTNGTGWWNPSGPYWDQCVQDAATAGDKIFLSIQYWNQNPGGNATLVSNQAAFAATVLNVLQGLNLKNSPEIALAVGNEEDLQEGCGTGCAPAGEGPQQYANSYAAISQLIHTDFPAALSVFGEASACYQGLSGTQCGIQWLAQAYSDALQEACISSCAIDAISGHPYTQPYTPYTINDLIDFGHSIGLPVFATEALQGGDLDGDIPSDPPEFTYTQATSAYCSNAVNVAPLSDFTGDQYDASPEPGDGVGGNNCQAPDLENGDGDALMIWLQ